MSNNLL